MTSKFLIAGALFAAGIAGWAILANSSNSHSSTPDASEFGAALVSVTVPDAFSGKAQIGQTAYQSICIDCHGKDGSGRNGMGPPLVHKIYEPSHHSDESFQRAVAAGVRSHHWSFGDMAAVDGLTRGDVVSIIAYIRALQRANGIL